MNPASFPFGFGQQQQPPYGGGTFVQHPPPPSAPIDWQSVVAKLPAEDLGACLDACQAVMARLTHRTPHRTDPEESFVSRPRKISKKDTKKLAYSSGSETDCSVRMPPQMPSPYSRPRQTKKPRAVNNYYFAVYDKNSDGSAYPVLKNNFKDLIVELRTAGKLEGMQPDISKFGVKMLYDVPGCEDGKIAMVNSVHTISCRASDADNAALIMSTAMQFFVEHGIACVSEGAQLTVHRGSIKDKVSTGAIVFVNETQSQKPQTANLMDVSKLMKILMAVFSSDPSTRITMWETPEGARGLPGVFKVLAIKETEQMVRFKFTTIGDTPPFTATMKLMGEVQSEHPDLAVRIIALMEQTVEVREVEEAVQRPPAVQYPRPPRSPSTSGDEKEEEHEEEQEQEQELEEQEQEKELEEEQEQEQEQEQEKMDESD